MRKTEKPEETLLAVCNFAAVPYDRLSSRRSVLSENTKKSSTATRKEYGGQGTVNPRGKDLQAGMNAMRESIPSNFKVPALGVTVFSCTPTKKKRSSLCTGEENGEKTCGKETSRFQKTSRAAVKEPAATVKEEKKVLVKEDSYCTEENQKNCSERNSIKNNSL